MVGAGLNCLNPADSSSRAVPYGLHQIFKHSFCMQMRTWWVRSMVDPGCSWANHLPTGLRALVSRPDAPSGSDTSLRCVRTIVCVAPWSTAPDRRFTSPPTRFHACTTCPLCGEVDCCWCRLACAWCPRLVSMTLTRRWVGSKLPQCRFVVLVSTVYFWRSRCVLFCPRSAVFSVLTILALISVMGSPSPLNLVIR